jgi:two-component system, OmpR family, response regulator MprA
MRKRVLLVDDDPDVLASFSLWLYDRYDVATAADGPAALAETSGRRFDVIVLDLMMPVMDGAALKYELDRRGVTTPVIVVSAAPDVKGRARALGAVDYLVKPIDLDALDAAIDRATGGCAPGGGSRSGGGPRGGGAGGPGGRQLRRGPSPGQRPPAVYVRAGCAPSVPAG